MDEINEEEQFTAEKPPVEEVPTETLVEAPSFFEQKAEVDAVLDQANAPVADQEQTYTVLEGEKLGDIAKKLSIAGGWPALFHKNRDLIGENPNHVTTGTVLVLP